MGKTFKDNPYDKNKKIVSRRKKLKFFSEVTNDYSKKENKFKK